MRYKLPHPTQFVESLDADIDVGVVSLVETINQFGFTTISSCQGFPGRIDDTEMGCYGHVAFISKDPLQYEHVVRFTFGFLRSFFGHMYDDVRLTINLSGDTGFVGWLYFRNEVLEDISKRLSTYHRMMSH